MEDFLKRNVEFVENGALVDREMLLEQRKKSVEGQSPSLVVLSCSDSRVVPEYALKAGIGEIFVIRTAGERIDYAALGSIEYAVSHLGVKELLVLGHENCGAVKAAWDAEDLGESALDRLVRDIVPVTNECRNRGLSLEDAIKENVRDVIKKLKSESEAIGRKADSGELRIYGGIYRLATGKVEIFE